MSKKHNSNKPTVIDLFSGAGGMTLGFEQAGFKNIFSIDNVPSYCTTYSHNFPEHKLIIGDIEKLSEETINQIVKGKEIDVIIGGPPCQGFSIAGNIGRKFIDDPRNQLFKEFARIVKHIRPKIFVMENVAKLYTHKQGQTRNEIIKLFESIGYKVDCAILKSELYGVPQKRSRVIFIGNRIGKKNLFPIPEDKIFASVESAIGDLPELLPGEISNVPNHNSMNHSKQMLTKMLYVTEGGSKSQIPEEIRPKGDARKYVRYNRSLPSFCITGDMRKVFHYSQNRALTVRELARLQTYPDSFVFYGSKISQQQQVGNSVPPLLAKLIAQSIKKMLHE